MKQRTRLLRYLVPYWWQLIPGLLLMAGVGLLDAFRVLLMRPVFDGVLSPGEVTHTIPLFKMPWTGQEIHLERFVPSHFQNVWTVVAFSLIASTITAVASLDASPLRTGANPIHCRQL